MPWDEETFGTRLESFGLSAGLIPKELPMNDSSSRNPMLVPGLELAMRALNSPVGKLASGFHVHSVDDTLSETYVESVMGTFHGLKVRSIRSLPRRPISLGAKTPPGCIDHVGMDFLEQPVPALLDFDGIRSLYPDAKIVVQENPNCCGILVARKLWVYLDGYPPLEFQLGPKGKGAEGCNPRPAWPA